MKAEKYWIHCFLFITKTLSTDLITEAVSLSLRTTESYKKSKHLWFHKLIKSIYSKAETIVLNKMIFLRVVHVAKFKAKLIKEFGSHFHDVLYYVVYVVKQTYPLPSYI